MKLKHIFSSLLFASVLSIGFVGCDMEIPDVPKSLTSVDKRSEENRLVVQPADTVVAFLNEIKTTFPDEFLTVQEAIDLCNEMSNGATTTKKYFVHGWVKSLDSKHASGVPEYGNGSFNLAEKLFADSVFNEEGDFVRMDTSKYSTGEFIAYQVYALNGNKFESADQVQVGDYVVIYGPLTLYSGKAETAGKGAAYVYFSTRLGLSEPITPVECNEDLDISGIVEPEGTITVEEAIAICQETGETAKKGPFYIKGFIRTIDNEVDAQYGNATFKLGSTACQDGDLFTCYRVKGPNGAKLTTKEQVKVGDYVIIYTESLVNFKGNTPENSGNAYIHLSTNSVLNSESETPDDPETPSDCNPVDISGIVEPAGTLTVAEAIAICKETGEAAKKGPFYVKGYVKSIKDAFSSQYGNVSFYIGESACEDGDTFLCYRAKGNNNANLTSADQVVVGDYVIIYAESLVNFKSNTPENSGTCYIHLSTNAKLGGNSESEEEKPEQPALPETLTPSEANAWVKASLKSGETTSTTTTITGWISSIKTAYSSQYDNITFYLADEEGGADAMQCFRVKGGKDLQKGMKVAVTGKLTNYNGTPETAAGATYTLLD